jgi:Fic family protein
LQIEDFTQMDPFVPEHLPVRLDWSAFIPLIGPANRAIANFNGATRALPNPDILLSPLTTQEAVLSSRIEGTQATLGEVLKFEAGEPPEQESRRLDAQEILNYRTSLRQAEDQLQTRPFNLNLLRNFMAFSLENPALRGALAGLQSDLLAQRL